MDFLFIAYLLYMCDVYIYVNVHMYMCMRLCHPLMSRSKGKRTLSGRMATLPSILFFKYIYGLF